MVVEESAQEDQRASSSAEINVKKHRPSSSTLASALSGTAGTIVRQMGGFGDYSTVSLRGSTAQQVNLYYDSIPLNPDGSTAINLSELPISPIKSIQIYRSMPPFELHSSAIGGAINLVPEEKSNRARFETASFGWIRAQAADSIGSTAIALDLLSSEGDFPVYLNQGTPFNEADDEDTVRSNNELRQASLFLHGSDQHYRWIYNALFRYSGQPGTENMQSEHTSLTTQRQLIGISYANQTTGATLWSHSRSDRFQDPLAELGSGKQDRVSYINSTGGSAHSKLRFANALIQLAARTRYEQLLDVDNFINRIVLSPSASGTIVIHPKLISELRLLQHNLYTFDTNNITTHAWTPQLSLRWQLNEQLYTWLGAEQRFRPPTGLELVGYSGLIKGNSELKPERANSAEIGVKHNSAQQISQACLFLTENTDHIVFVQNAQREAIPINLSRSQILGAELSAQFNLDVLRSESSATWMSTQNLSDNETTYGNALPNIPSWQLSQRSTVTAFEVSLTHHWMWSSTVNWDTLGWFSAPPRSLHSVDLSHENGPWKIDIGVTNLFDNRTQELSMDPLRPELGTSTRAVMDFVGLPISGRRLVAGITWTPEKS